MIYKDFIKKAVHDAIDECPVENPEELEKVLTKALYDIFRSEDFSRFIRGLQK